MRWGELVARPLHEHAMVGKVRSHSLELVQNRMVSCLSESPVYSDNAWQCLNSVEQWHRLATAPCAYARCHLESSIRRASSASAGAADAL